ncbi:MAG: DPP IV N-terminal domain-containing protein [Cyclobacteriaceae bacterium]
MIRCLTILWILGCLLVSCEEPDLIQETDPNGLYAPYLTSLRNDGEVTLKWGKPACAMCGGCPCSQLHPDYFEVLYSETDQGKLQVYTVVDNDVSETTVDHLDNQKPYYFAIKAVISGEKYTISETIMVIPNTPENVNQLFNTVDKEAKLGSWSPDQSSVAYVGDYVWNDGNYSAQSVFISSSSGENSYLVEKYARSPEWSPGGQQIVYQTDNEEANTSPGYRPTHLAIYDVNDSTVSRLTSGNSFNYLPTWSADGEWIAYLSDRAGGNEYNIWKIPSTGGPPIQVTTDFNDLSDLAIKSSRSPEILSWSADGKRIAFARYNSSTPLKTDIYSVTSDGDDLQTMITSPWNDYCPAYSPDGEKIAFISDRSGKLAIWTMDLQTKKLSQISGSTEKWIYVNAGKIAWSSSGDKILFTSSENDFFTLYSVDVD